MVFVTECLNKFAVFLCKVSDVRLKWSNYAFWVSTIWSLKQSANSGKVGVAQLQVNGKKIKNSCFRTSHFENVPKKFQNSALYLI